MRFTRRSLVLATLLSFFVLTPGAPAQQQDGFTLGGKVPGLASRELKLYSFTFFGGVDSIIATTTTDKEGAFTFTGRLEHPVPAALGDDAGFYILFYLENGTVTLQAAGSPVKGFNDLQVTGSGMHRDFDAFQKQTENVGKTNLTEMNRQKVLFIESHPDSYFGLAAMMDINFYESVSVEAVDKLYAGLSAGLKDSVPGQEMARLLADLKARSR